MILSQFASPVEGSSLHPFNGTNSQRLANSSIERLPLSIDESFPNGCLRNPLLSSHMYEPLAQVMERLELDDVDKLVAQEMTKLSLTEREKVLDDLHAIANTHFADEPSPLMREKRLMEFQHELDFSIVADQKAAYELACQKNSCYVRNEAFRVQFLRADFWDPYKAALRLTKHFEVKLKLFGQDLLCEEITQDDLDTGTLKVLYGGLIQDLPLRDTAGRFISFVIPNPNDGTILQKLRRIFYAIMVKIEDEETQIKGRVIIIWAGKYGMDRSAALEVAKMLVGMPTRWSATHICITGGKRNFMYGSVAALFSFAVESLTRLRMKYHFGTPVELKGMLQAHGIPSFIIPISDDGQVITNHANTKWAYRRLEERQKRARRSMEQMSYVPGPSIVCEYDGQGQTGEHNEEFYNNSPLDTLDNIWELDSNSSIGFKDDQPTVANGSHHDPSSYSVSSMDDALTTDVALLNSNAHAHLSSTFDGLIATPSNHDVLLGRGRWCQQHLGNIRFRALIDTHQSRYDAANKADKIAMADELVELLKCNNGRFLKEDGSGWSEVPHCVARTKVATCFRTTRHRKKKVANK